MHDLTAINAALRLGDPAVPPVGAKCYLHGELKGWGSRLLLVQIRSVSREGVVTSDFEQFHWVLRMWFWPLVGVQRPGTLKNLTRNLPLALPKFFEVISVPDGALPFEDWQRDFSVSARVPKCITMR